MNHIFGPTGEILDRQAEPGVFRAPLRVSVQDAAERDVLFFQISHLLVQRIPGPLPFFRFDRFPTRVGCPMVRDADLGHLGNPVGVRWPRPIVAP